MKAILTITLLICVAVTMVAPPTFAGDENAAPRNVVQPYDPPSDSPPGEFILVDALIIRPISFVACAIGLAGSAVVFPFTAATHGQDRVKTELIEKPFQFTFTRPLGDIEGAN